MTTIALALAAMRLARQEVMLHDMKSVETLARVNVLCVDKTGTITEPKMAVEKAVSSKNFTGDLSSIIADFAKNYKRVVVVEEGDPYMTTLLKAAGINVEDRAEKWRFGELNVDAVKAQIEGNLDFAQPVLKAKPPQLCKGCPHVFSFAPLVELGCIVAGDIGCYTLAAMKPISGMDMQICMGASIGMGLGLRKVLPEEKARKVVSVIGDSTFMHSGLTGLLEMVYNPPATGHIVVVVDNSTTAMTGQQENPGTGRKLDHSPTNAVSIERVAEAIGIQNVKVFNPVREGAQIKEFISEKMKTNELTLVVLRQTCILAAAQLAKRKA